MWPASTAGHNLQSKFSRYKGNGNLYQKARKPYYSGAATGMNPEPASKSIMVESSFGKYQSNPIMGTGAMETTRYPILW